MIVQVVRLLRPNGWIKNLFVFLPSFSATIILVPSVLIPTLFAFVTFCLAASAVYIFNDIFDVEEDRAHPTKRDRPIASGKISIGFATVIDVILALAAFGFSLTYSQAWAPILLGTYFMLNIAYSLGLKHIPVLDVFIVCSGFVVRLLFGAMIAKVEVSHWLMLMTILSTLILAVGKRKDDVAILLSTGKTTRKVVHGYNNAFLDVSLAFLSAIVVVAYIIYCESTPFHSKAFGGYFYLTAVVVLFGVLRYLQQILVYKKSADPTELIRNDPILMVSFLAWIVSISVMLYL